MNDHYCAINDLIYLGYLEFQNAQLCTYCKYLRVKMVSQIKKKAIKGRNRANSAV